jgi:hypothetical protein
VPTCLTCGIHEYTYLRAMHTYPIYACFVSMSTFIFNSIYSTSHLYSTQYIQLHIYIQLNIFNLISKGPLKESSLVTGDLYAAIHIINTHCPTCKTNWNSSDGAPVVIQGSLVIRCKDPLKTVEKFQVVLQVAVVQYLVCRSPLPLSMYVCM